MSDLGNKAIFAENLNWYMELNGKKQIDVCNDLGIKTTTFNEWAMGNAYPRIDKIEALANYFNIKKSNLIEKRKVAPEWSDVRADENARIFDSLTEEQKDEALRYMKYLLQEQGRD